MQFLYHLRRIQHLTTYGETGISTGEVDGLRSLD
jgi:hypothetical protein